MIKWLIKKCVTDIVDEARQEAVEQVALKVTDNDLTLFMQSAISEYVKGYIDRVCPQIIHEKLYEETRLDGLHELLQATLVEKYLDKQLPANVNAVDLVALVMDDVLNQVSAHNDDARKRIDEAINERCHKIAIDAIKENIEDPRIIQSIIKQINSVQLEASK